MNMIKSSDLIKYLAFDQKPPELGQIPDGMVYNESDPQFSVLSNFMIENVLQDFYRDIDERTYTGRCYSEWTCGEGTITRDIVRFDEMQKLQDKFIILYVK